MSQDVFPSHHDLYFCHKIHFPHSGLCCATKAPVQKVDFLSPNPLCPSSSEVLQSHLCVLVVPQWEGQHIWEPVVVGTTSSVSEKQSFSLYPSVRACWGLPSYKCSNWCSWISSRAANKDIAGIFQSLIFAPWQPAQNRLVLASAVMPPSLHSVNGMKGKSLEEHRYWRLSGFKTSADPSLLCWIKDKLVGHGTDSIFSFTAGLNAFFYISLLICQHLCSGFWPHHVFLISPDTGVELPQLVYLDLKENCSWL